MFVTKTLIIIFTTLCLLFIGCAKAGDDPVDEISRHTGLIYSIEENRILVVKDIESVNIPWSSWSEAGKRAIYFSISADTEVELDGKAVNSAILERGQTVEVWYSGGLAQSYPEQGGADKVIVINSTAAAKMVIESGRYSGRDEEGEILLVSIRISGTPEGIPAKVFRLTPEAGALLHQINPNDGEEILFRYLEDAETAGLIFDLSLLRN